MVVYSENEERDGHAVLVLKHLWILALVMLLAGCGGGGGNATALSGVPMRLFVPLYAWPDLAAPGNDWQRVASAGLVAPTTAVVNPSNGPLTPPPQPFLDGIALLKASGVRVLGYVATGFAGKPQAQVQAEIDAYLTYGVDGVFLDEAAGNVTYYQQVCSHARGLGYRAVLNPGAPFPNAYVDSALGCDAAVVFEDVQPLWVSYRLDTANAQLPPQKLIALVLATPSTALATSLDHAARLPVGAVLVSDRSDWMGLPSYFETEAGMVGNLQVH